MANQFTKWLDHLTFYSAKYENSNCFPSLLTLSMVSHFSSNHYIGYLAVSGIPWWLIW